MQKAISTPNQGPRSKIMSEKNQGKKSRVSVPVNPLAIFLIVKPHWKGLYKTFLMRSGNQKSSRRQGKDIDFRRRHSIFVEIDILTLSVTRFLIVGTQ